MSDSKAWDLSTSGVDKIDWPVEPRGSQYGPGNIEDLHNEALNLYKSSKAFQISGHDVLRGAFLAGIAFQQKLNRHRILRAIDATAAVSYAVQGQCPGADTLATDRSYSGSPAEDLRNILDGLPQAYQIPGQNYQADAFRERTIAQLQATKLPAEVEAVCQRAEHLRDVIGISGQGLTLQLQAKPEKSLADKISAYAAHLLDQAGAEQRGNMSPKRWRSTLERSEFAAELAAVIFRAEEHDKRG